MRAIAVIGPTASGKSALAVCLAQRLSGEVISCDSMQIYRGMDIGTAKPTEREMCGIRHHLLDFADPRKLYSAGDYAKDASSALSDILSRGKMPILCGGTGLYLEALRTGRHEGAPDGDEALRLQLLKKAEEEGGESLYRRLAELDPEAAAAIHPNNLRRVIRALEIYLLSGRTKSEYDRRSEELPDACRCLPLYLHFENRELLYERINRRVDLMVEAGLVEEVSALYRAGMLLPESTAGQAIGYRQLVSYIEGKCTLNAAIEEIKLASRHYAKRQMTWFRKTRGAVTLMADRNGICRKTGELADEAMPLIEQFIRETECDKERN